MRPGLDWLPRNAAGKDPAPTMRSIAILQHEELQGPGFLEQCLQRQGWNTRVFRLDQGDAVPADSRDFSGIVMLGSDHSVHDPLSWIEAERGC